MASSQCENLLIDIKNQNEVIKIALQEILKILRGY